MVLEDSGSVPACDGREPFERRVEEVYLPLDVARVGDVDRHLHVESIVFEHRLAVHHEE